MQSPSFTTTNMITHDELKLSPLLDNESNTSIGSSLLEEELMLESYDGFDYICKVNQQ